MDQETKTIPFSNQNNPKSQFDLIRLEDVLARQYKDHSPLDQHRVEFYILILIEHGQGYHTIDFKDFECSTGSLLAIRKNQIHKFWKDNNLKGRLLMFTNDFLVSYLEELEAHKTILLFNEFLGSPKLQLSKSDLTSIYNIVDRIEEEYLSVQDKHSMNIIRSELHIMITKLFRIKAREENTFFEKKHLQEFITLQQLIENNVCETTKVQDFASMMGVSSKTLNTITKSIVHKTAKGLIDEICIKQIKRLLINTRLSIKEVAYQSGFHETTNFYKYFKRHTHKTPEQFRASC